MEPWRFTKIASIVLTIITVSIYIIFGSIG